MSSRRFSKQIVAANIVAAWGAIYLAIIYLQAGAVVASGFGFIALIAGAYMGVGHADYKAFLRHPEAQGCDRPMGNPPSGDFPPVDTSMQEKN